MFKVENEEQSQLLDYENPAFEPKGWDERRWSVQSWFERTAWKTLSDTKYGRPLEEQIPNSCLWDDPLLRQIYLLDIATFITAEHVSMLAVAGMVRSAPDESAQIHLSTQVLDEARHYEVFCRRLADFGITPEQRVRLLDQVTSKPMQNFYDLIMEQVDKGDFVAASLAQNITMEGMAYPLYRYEIKYWSRFDPSLSQIIRGAFADEAHHVSFGESIVRAQLEGWGNAKRSQMVVLLRQFQTLMTEVFEQMIKHYIGLYQEAANGHMELIGDLEIFPGHKMKDVTEEDQVRLLLNEIQSEQRNRLKRIGVEV